MTNAVLGVIGGSGIYDLPGLEDVREEIITSPWGEPSAALTRGVIDGLPIAFLPRHGKGHALSPSEINYRANIDVLKRAGVTDLISLSACGSFKEELPPGTFVLVDQFVDRTFNRQSSFFGKGCVAHVSMAHPVSPRLRIHLAAAAEAEGIAIARGFGEADVQPRRHRMRHRHVRDAAFAEERGLAQMRAVDELVDHDEGAGWQFLLERAAGRQRDKVGDAGAFEDVDVGAVVDVGGRQAVALVVARQEDDRQAVDVADAQGARRLAGYGRPVFQGRCGVPDVGGRAAHGGAKAHRLPGDDLPPRAGGPRLLHQEEGVGDLALTKSGSTILTRGPIA